MSNTTNRAIHYNTTAVTLSCGCSVNLYPEPLNGDLVPCGRHGVARYVKIKTKYWAVCDTADCEWRTRPTKDLGKLLRRGRGHIHVHMDQGFHVVYWFDPDQPFS